MIGLCSRALSRSDIIAIAIEPPPPLQCPLDERARAEVLLLEPKPVARMMYCDKFREISPTLESSCSLHSRSS